MASYWTPKDYTQFFLIDEPTHTPAEIRAEYSHMRDTILRRADRLEAAGIGDVAKYMRESMPKLHDIKDSAEVAKRLAQGWSIKNTKSYSMKGIKRLQKQFNKETGEFIPLGDVLPFADYMKSWRLSAFSASIVPSQEAADYHPNEYQEIGGSFADFYTLFKQGI